MCIAGRLMAINYTETPKNIDGLQKGWTVSFVTNVSHWRQFQEF